MANKANDATEANETDEAEATEVCEEASKAKCSDETIEACPLDFFLLIESSERYFGICVDRSGCNNQLGLDLLIVAKEAIGVANTANELDELVVAKGRDELDKLVVAKGHDELDELVVTKGRDEFDMLIVAKGHDELDKLIVAKGWADGHGVVICRLRLDNAIANTLSSLTKYSTIAAEVKEYFGISAPNNQHGQKSLCSLRNRADNKLAEITIVEMGCKSLLEVVSGLEVDI